MGSGFGLHAGSLEGNVALGGLQILRFFFVVADAVAVVFVFF